MMLKLLLPALTVVAMSAFADDVAFDPSQCQGSPMAQQQALTYFTAGSSVSRPVTTFTYVERERTCNTLTGCTSWVAVDVSTMPNYEATGEIHLSTGATGIYAILMMGKGFSISTNLGYLDQIVAPDRAVPSNLGVPDYVYSGDGQVAKVLAVAFNNDCFQVVVDLTGTPDRRSSYVQTQFAALSFF